MERNQGSEAMGCHCKRRTSTMGHGAARPPARLIAGVAMLMGLLLCSGANARERPTPHALAALPDSVLGAWHRNDEHGRLRCKAYRNIKSASEITEETGGLVGALMITSQLMHGYAEYGEGAFYVVKRVAELGSQRWDVDALVGIDSMPEAGVGGQEERFRLDLSSGLLTMTEGNAADGPISARVFFRCGKVLDGMYSRHLALPLSSLLVGPADLP